MSNVNSDLDKHFAAIVKVYTKFGVTRQAK